AGVVARVVRRRSQDEDLGTARSELTRGSLDVGELVADALRSVQKSWHESADEAHPIAGDVVPELRRIAREEAVGAELCRRKPRLAHLRHDPIAIYVAAPSGRCC